MHDAWFLMALSRRAYVKPEPLDDGGGGDDDGEDDDEFGDVEWSLAVIPIMMIVASIVAIKQSFHMASSLPK